MTVEGPVSTLDLDVTELLEEKNTFVMLINFISHLVLKCVLQIHTKLLVSAVFWLQGFGALLLQNVKNLELM